MRNRVAVLHGVNLDALDRRPAAHYGELTFTQLERQIDRFARELGLDARFFHTNHEGEYVEEIHKASDYADGLLLNPGAWTHYAWALRDAVEISGLPVVEVHLSDVMHREPFRRLSVLDGRRAWPRCRGKGVDGYRDALARAEGGAREPSRPGRRGAGRARARRAAGHRPRQPALPDRVHGLQRHGGRRAATCAAS